MGVQTHQYYLQDLYAWLSVGLGLGAANALPGTLSGAAGVMVLQAGTTLWKRRVGSGNLSSAMARVVD